MRIAMNEIRKEREMRIRIEEENQTKINEKITKEK